MKTHEYAPIQAISENSGLPSEETTHSLRKLHMLGLVLRRSGAEVGYTANSSGFDCLAIRELVKKNSLSAFGRTLGIGKESDVYDALSDDKRVAVKFHRLGRVSFRQTKRLRPYTHEHASPTWHHESSHAAAREFAALNILYPAQVAVPEPIARNRHVLVMGLIEGDPLYICTYLPEPRSFLKTTIENVKMAWNLGVVHSDLSEYNIIVTPALTPLIIDWPQWTPTSQTNAYTKLSRDVSNILKFFKRRFKTDDELTNLLRQSGLPYERLGLRFDT